MRAILAGMILALADGTARAQDASRQSMDLSGEWEFRIDPEDRGRAEEWFEGKVPFDRKIRVPGAWNAQGVAFESEPQLREYEKLRLNGTNLPGTDRESEKLFSVFPGPAWYRKTFRIPEKWRGVSRLVFRGVHRYAEVWVNGVPSGSHLSYLTPMRVDFSRWARPGETVTVVVRVDARRNKAVDPLMGCLDTLDFLYVSWGGLYGKVTLESTGPAWIADVFARPLVRESTVEILASVVYLGSRRDRPFGVAVEIADPSGRAVARGEGAAEAAIRVVLPEPKLWTPRTPDLYTARVRLLDEGVERDAVSTRFGMRELAVENGRFLLNGRPVFLRGYGDDCIFPNTVAPPADKEEFRRRLSIARDYGFNYVRHHSWFPPEEYFEAADEVGLMVQPEFPIAYRWDLAATPEAKRRLLEQWGAVIRLRRNHPSLVTWCMGNELYDSFEQAPEMYRIAKTLDPGRLVIDSDGCSFKHRGRATLDFMVVQFNEGASIGFGDGKYSGIPADLMKPVIAHEMGYFVTLPDLSQINLFKGGIRPYWLLQTRDLAASRGVAALYPEWLERSYRLQAVCLKTNIEAARRSRLGGYSAWLFQDYPNCAEGVVDMFFRPKALSAAEFRKFNAPTVLLLDAPRRSFRFGESAAAALLVSRFEDAPSERAALRWELRAGKEVLASGRKEGLSVASEGVQELAKAELAIPRRPKAERLTLAAELEDENGKAANEWNLWAFPGERPQEFPRRVRVEEPFQRFGPAGADLRPSEGDLLVTAKADAATLDFLEQGGRVLLLEPEPLFGVEKTNYRLSSWDGGGPSGTAIDREHPALRATPSDGWADLHFYPLIQGSKTVFLDPLPAKVRPIVRCIDRPQRLSHRAYLFEVSAGKGRLVVSGFNFAGALKAEDPAAVFLFDQLIRYAAGRDFAPAATIPVEFLRGRLKK